ncbi:MAG TPA: hypothetical protein VHZ29_02455, partial [Rhizomicrobium sp.]|nr:hypothetical protein [Rhizomicrobium sp.]
MILKTKEIEFRTLFTQYVEEFLKVPEGQEHLYRYDEARAIGRRNFEDIRAAAENGANVTREVLQRLLPHTNSAAHRASDAWIHIAPAVQKNIQEWFEGAGWTQPEDWPKVTVAILNFVSECADDPSLLATAAKQFSDDPYTTGLQTGMLTPILNAVRPDDFLILNNKSRRVMNYFTGNNFKQPLVNYSDANKAELSLRFGGADDADAERKRRAPERSIRHVRPLADGHPQAPVDCRTQGEDRRRRSRRKRTGQCDRRGAGGRAYRGGGRTSAIVPHSSCARPHRDEAELSRLGA